MSPSQDTDVRLQGFIKGVSLVMLLPRRTDLDLVRRQAEYWSFDDVAAWRRWTNIGMDSYFLFFILASGLICWVVIKTDWEPLAVLISAMFFIPMLADRYRVRRGWL